jgi:hypothetical protein
LPQTWALGAVEECHMPSDVVQRPAPQAGAYDNAG